MKYVFGGSSHNPYSSNSMRIEAKSLEFAVRKFILSAEVPEKYVEQNIFGDYDLKSSLYKIDKNKVSQAGRITIPVGIYEKNDEGREAYKKVRDLDFQEVLDADFDRLISESMGGAGSLPLLESDDQKAEEAKKEIVLAGLPQIRTNRDYRQVRDKIREKMAELEKQKEELEAQVSALQEWMKSKYRVIEAIETYLGTHEEIVALVEDKERADELPLHIYQQKLYMDEEYGIVNDVLDRVEDAVDFDYNSLALFDDWIQKHFKMYMPHKKSICVFQVCRNRKSYGDVWEDMVMDGKNGITYFLIRNGENLYRIFSGIRVPDSVFPTLRETEEIYKEAERWEDGEDGKQKRVNEQMLPWKYVTAYLQGLIDRSEVLGTNLRGKVNFMLNLVPKEFCVLERNMEAENWISDKTKPLWHDYLKSVNEETKAGDLIMITGLKSMGHDREGEYYFMGAHGISGERRWVESPSTQCYYKVEKKCLAGEGELEGHTYYMWKGHPYYKILYYETNNVIGRDRYHWDEHERKRRTGFWLSEDEFLNLSRVSEKELEFYLTDRRYRRDYLRSIPEMKVALKMLRDIKTGVKVGNKGRARRY